MNEFMVILIRYDEIGLKGKNRKYFERTLLKNIQFKLRDVKSLKSRIPHGRILLYVAKNEADESCRLLKEVSGISSFSVGIPVAPDPDIISRWGMEWIDPLLRERGGLRFRVKTQRSDKTFPVKSPQFNEEVASRILRTLGDRGLFVDLTQPEFTLEIEIGMEETVVFNNRIPGLGGLPVGVSGQVLTLLSGGIDSPVAAYMTIRRGCRSHFVFFDNQPYLGRGGYEKVNRLAQLVNRYQWKGNLFVIPFDKIQENIRDHCTPDHRVVLYRRMMYRIAESLAKQEGYLGLVTGESIGQVASQTLENLAAVSCVTTTNVFRPLIGMDKVDIIALAKKINTYETSIEPQPDCCSVFMPPHPVTRSRIRNLEVDESKYPWQDLMQGALEARETIVLGRS